MLNKKVIASLFISIFFLNFAPLFGMAATSSVATTNANASAINLSIMSYYIPKLKSSGSAIAGQGHDEGSAVVYPGENAADIFGVENVYALPALNRFFAIQGDSRGDQYANDIINSIASMFSSSGSYNGLLHDDSGDWDTIRITMEQFIMLDMLSEFFLQTKNDRVYGFIRAFFMVSDNYEANTTIGHPGGYWTQLRGEFQDKEGESGYDTCNANTSLMAATAYSRFALALAGHVDEATLKPVALIKAEEAMAYVETYCYKKGFYTEHPNDASGIAKFSTQALAVNALALLYEATGKTFYLTKADALLNSISAAFWDVGRGGAMELYDVASGSIASGEGSMKYGYHNALLAMGCIDLYIATLNSKYLGLSMDIMNFLYNTFWKETGTNIRGYTEWCLRNGTKAVPTKYNSMNVDCRMVNTNMIALRVNSHIVYAIKPWFEKYSLYLFIGIGVAVVAVIVAGLIIKKKSAGRSLPKVVKGLLGDEE
jgi:hypothetical protein